MKKRKIFGGALLLVVAVLVAGNIYDRYPHAGDVKNLPKGKPVIVLSFHGAPPEDLQYMSVSLSYSARRPNDRGVSRHKSCDGFIIHLHPCSVVVETIQRYPTGYVDRERGEISFPIDMTLYAPGDYRLDGFAVVDNRYRYVGSEGRFSVDDNNFRFDDRQFSLVQSAGAPVHAAGFARHVDAAKNVLIRTRPGTFDIVGSANVIPYFPDADGLHRALLALRETKYEDPDNRPVGFINREGHFVMSAMTSGHLEMGPDRCHKSDSERLKRELAKKPLFKKIENAKITLDPADDKDRCEEVTVGDKGHNWHTYLVRSRGNKILASRSGSEGLNYIDAMWVDKKLVYAFALKQERTRDDEAPVSVHFLDDEFIKIYPDEKKDFPARELEQLELAVGQIMAARGQLGVSP